MTKPPLDPKVAALLRKPGPVPKADKVALSARMNELGKKPRQQPKARVEKKGNSRGR